MGYEGRTASSTVPEEAVPRLRASGGKVKPGSKPRAATAEQLPTRAVEARKEQKRRTEDGKVKAGVATAVLAPPVAAEAPAQPEPAPLPAAAAPTAPAVRVPRGSTAQDLAARLAVSPADIVKKLFQLGEMVSITQSLPDDAIELVATELGHHVEVVAPTEEVEEEEEEEAVDESRLQTRPPVVTVMGHVDHGKTLLLDAIRRTDVVAQEFGGITQHIGAYQVHHDGRIIPFIDSPGHEAFTAMRARGAQATDIAVLVVAADDGVMPQTVEALNHAKAAKVPVVVAVNKIDKPEADPQRTRQQLVEQELVPEEWGGDTLVVEVSGTEGTGVPELLDAILLVADVQDPPLMANPKAPARAYVLEANLDPGRGPVATVLVESGILHVSDPVVA